MFNKIRSEGYLFLFVAVLVFLSSATPGYFFKWFDAIFYLMVDGEWTYADVLQYLIALFFCLVLAGALLDWRQWPWQILLVWIPYAVWVFAGSLWSIYPRYSFHESVHDVLLAQAVFLLAYAAIYSRAIELKQVIFVAGGAVFYCVIQAVFFRPNDIEQLPYLFDGVLFSNWYSYLLALALPVLWMRSRHEQWGLASWAVLLLLSFTFFANMRIVWLAGLVLWGLSHVLGWRWGLSRTQAPQSRRVMVFMLWALIFLLGYRFVSIYKISGISETECAAPAVNSLNVNDELAPKWIRTFKDNERYSIWSFYVRQSIEHDKWLGGVGLGWENPAFAYAKNKPECFPLGWVSHGHNHLLNQYLQTGLIGVVFYLAAWAFLFWQIVRLATSRQRSVRCCALGLMCLLTMLLAKNFTDDGMRDQNILLFFMLLGLLYGRAKRSLRSGGTEDALYSADPVSSGRTL